MAIKSCVLNEWRSALPKNCKLLSFSYGDFLIPVDTPFVLLAAGCHLFMKEGILTAKGIQRLGVNWIKTNPRMKSPRHVIGPCYISEDGSGNTPIGRLEFLAMKFNVDCSKCIIEYAEDDVCVFNDKKALNTAISYLQEWEGGSAMPPDATQIEFYKFDDYILPSFYPYKLVIGEEQYEVEGWVGCLNTYISYLYCKYPNGPSKLYDISKAVDWDRKFIIESLGEIDFCPFDKTEPIEEIIQIIRDLTEKVCLDKYSAYIVSVPEEIGRNEKLSEHGNDIEDCRAVDYEIDEENNGETDAGGNGIILNVEVEAVGYSRHFRPRITVR